MSSAARVLLVTRGGAVEQQAISTALRARGVEPVLYDSAAFPTGAPLQLHYGRGGFEEQAVPEAAAVSAVWHSLVIGSELPAMAPGVRETCMQASELAIIGWLDSLQVFQLDPHWRKARADTKPYQLRVAAQLGFEIPETLITNDADAVRAFARRCGPVITKMLVQPASTGPALDEADVVFTTALTDDDLAQLEGLELCPMIFQAQLANHADVRITVVGREVFGAMLDAPVRAGGDLDWRRDSYAREQAPRWTPCDVPAPLADRVRRLLDHFELNYGAVDFVVRGDGSHVFLELNASGSFAFLGEPQVTAIASAIAALLVDPATRRVPGPA